MRESLASGTALVCVMVVAALVRWSQWWPHSDLRQIAVNVLTGVSGVVGLGALVFALRRLDGQRRWFLMGLVVLAAAAGVFGGFELLRSATANLR